MENKYHIIPAKELQKLMDDYNVGGSHSHAVKSGMKAVQIQFPAIEIPRDEEIEHYWKERVKGLGNPNELIAGAKWAIQQIFKPERK